MARPKGVKPPTVSVRCLGPGPEHWWGSTDPVRWRVCPRCQDKIDRLAGCRVVTLALAHTPNVRID